MKFKVYLDSGANIHSRKEQVIDLEQETGISPRDWSRMTETQRDEVMRPIAFETLDWGWEEITN